MPWKQAFTTLIVTCLLLGALPAAPQEAVDEPTAEETAGAIAPFDCGRLDGLWAGQSPAPPDAAGEAPPVSRAQAAVLYAEYCRYLLLGARPGTPCMLRYDPLVQVANACARLARNQGSVLDLAQVVGGSPDTIQAVWLLDAIVQGDRAHMAAWTQYFGRGPAYRIIDMLFGALPSGAPAVYQALFFLTGTAQGAHADYIARQFLDLFASQPVWVVQYAALLEPFAPSLRVIFCTYLNGAEREALMLLYAQLPASDAQAAILELIACL